MGAENILKYIGNIIIPTGGLIICEYFAVIQPFYTPMTAPTYNTLIVPPGPYWNFANLSNTTIFLCL